MIFLNAVNRSLELVLSGAAASVDPHYVMSYADVNNTSGSLTPGAKMGQTNGGTAVTSMAAPASGVQRQLKFMSAFNADTAAVTITLRYNNNSTLITICTVTLQVGETLEYDAGSGFRVMTVLKQPKLGAVPNAFSALSPFLPVAYDGASLSTTTTLTSGNCQAMYLGICPKISTSIDVLYRVTTALATITTAEMGIFRGERVDLSYNTAVVLEKLCVNDMSVPWASTGVKKTNFALSPAARAGDHLWVLVHTRATTNVQFRAGLAPGVSSPLYMTASILTGTKLINGTSPLQLGTNSTVLRPWMAAYVN